MCPLRYTYPIAPLLTQFKFAAHRHIGRVLGRLLADAIERARPRKPDLLIPVPLHPSRLRERGFNQAQELARPIATRLGLALNVDVCRRIRATAPQTRLSARGRRRNLRGAFTITGHVRGADVALVDDVLTTGATTGELTRLLKLAGVRSVMLWVCARADQRVSMAV